MDTTHNPSPTGDHRMDKLLPYAARAVRAAHNDSPLGVTTAIADAGEVYGDEIAGLRALVVLLAGMCPDDADPEVLLAWRRNPVEYRRLRELGVPAAQAGELAARVSERLKGLPA